MSNDSVSQPAVSPAAAPSGGRWAELRSLFSLSIWPVADQAVVSASNFLTNIIVARVLGPHDFGVFTLGWSAVLLAQLLQFCLITTPMFTLAAGQALDKRPFYFGALARFESVLAAGVAVLLLGGAATGGRLSPDWPPLGFAAALAAAGGAYLWQDWAKRALFTNGRPGPAILSDALSYPLQLLAMLALLKASGELDRVLWVMAATSGLGAIAAWRPLRMRRPDAALLRETALGHWRFGRWMLGTVPLTWVVGNMIQLAGGTLLGAEAVAGIRAVALLFAAGNAFFLSLDNFVPRHAAAILAEKGWPAFARFMRHWIMIGVGVGVLISAALSLCPGFWLRLAFGPALAGFDWMVYPFALQFPMSCFILVSGMGLRTAGLNAAVFQIWGGMALVATITAFPGIWLFGLTGAMGSLLISYLAGCALTVVYTLRAAELHRVQ